MQGWPVFKIHADDVEPAFERWLRLAKVPRHHQVRMAGNGMNCVVIGQLISICVHGVQFGYK